MFASFAYYYKSGDQALDQWRNLSIASRLPGAVILDATANNDALLPTAQGPGADCSYLARCA